VVQVDPRLSTEFGLATVEGLVQLDSDQRRPAAGHERMVDVISGRAEGVALVPVEALRELDGRVCGVRDGRWPAPGCEPWKSD
jgi:hypothetical protein